jgi:hypothetical protein
MNILRKAVTTLGGVFLAALLITSLAPRAVRGITATLVQVTNTSANPVPTVSDDANFPYEALLCYGECGANSVGAFAVPTTTTTGVAVERLVIEDLNASCELATPGPAFVSLIVPFSADNNGNPPALNQYIFPLTPFGSAGLTFGHAIVRIYADPSVTTASVSLLAATESGVALSAAAGACNVVLTGHLETK